MEAVASFFVLLSIIIGHLDFASGLQCKIGVSDSSAHENSTNTNCDVGSQYCYALMCSAGPSAFILWGCSANQDKIACADDAKNWMENRQENARNILCKCKFGEKGKDLENAKFALPVVPTKVPSQNTTTKNLLICKVGVFGENGYGNTKLDDCLEEQHEYCFAASCIMNGTIKDIWGCYSTNNCSELSKTFGNNCHFCKFGKKRVDIKCGKNGNGTILLKKTCNGHLICYISKMAKDSGNWKYGGRFRVNNPNKGLADKCAGNDGTKGWHGLKITEESNGTVTFSNNLNGNLYYSLVSNGSKHLKINITKTNGQFVEEEFLKALRFGAFLNDYDGMAFRIAAMEMLRNVEENDEKLCKKTEQDMKATPASSTVTCLALGCGGVMVKVGVCYAFGQVFKYPLADTNGDGKLSPYEFSGILVY
uniref:EF-hand domain-containing protein n=1 Tax=Globodera pallida TaxID=36090 RepID=A0A183CID7_GLOPA